VIVRVVAKANKLAVVVTDVIRAACVKYEALLVVATTSFAQDISRELHCSEAKCVECSLNVRLCIGNDSDVSSACRRLSVNLVSVPRSPFISSFVGECKLAIVASSDVCVLAVVAISSYG
jgi:hypothetical protein